MKTIFYLFFLLSSLSFIPNLAIAKDSCQTTVKFPKNSKIITYRAKISGYNYCDYILAVKKGQKLTTWLTSKHSNVIIIDGFDVNTIFLEIGEPIKIPKTAKITLRVLMMRAIARRGTIDNYRLKIKLY